MKIHIQYGTNQANPTVVDVETDDQHLDPEDQLKHAADALDMALKVVWGERATPTEPSSRVADYTFSVGTTLARDEFTKWYEEMIAAAVDDTGRPLVKVTMDDERNTFADPDVDLDGRIKLVNRLVDIYGMPRQFITHNSSRAVGKAIKEALEEEQARVTEDFVQGSFSKNRQTKDDVDPGESPLPTPID